MDGSESAMAFSRPASISSRATFLDIKAIPIPSSTARLMARLLDSSSAILTDKLVLRI